MDAGDRVVPDQILAELNRDQSLAQFREAEANLQTARADVVAVRAELERSRIHPRTDRFSGPLPETGIALRLLLSEIIEGCTLEAGQEDPKPKRQPMLPVFYRFYRRVLLSLPK